MTARVGAGSARARRFNAAADRDERRSKMLTLYKFGNSICTQKVMIALAEKGAVYETIHVDLFKNEQYSPAYLRINPKGVVPSLVDGGRVVIESTLICEYLDETIPAPPLSPGDPHARARMRLWSKAVDEGLFEATRELSFSAMFRERMRAMTEEQRQGRFRNVGDAVKRARFMSVYADGVESPYVYEGIAAFEKAFANMEEDLADARPWLLGDALTLADIALMPFVARLDYLTLLDVWTTDRPHVQAWWQRAQARPSFRSAIPEALGAQEIEAMRTSGAKIRARTAEKRAEYVAFKKTAPRAA
jgi:glutathione S-transferase